MKKVSKSVLKKKTNRLALEKKAIQGARKAVKEYRQVFERLAAYECIFPTSEVGGRFIKS